MRPSITLQQTAAENEVNFRAGRGVSPVTRVARGKAQYLPPAEEGEQSQHDHQLSQQVRQALLVTDAGRLRPVSVETIRGRVRLFGKVPTYYAKLLAQTAAMTVDGVSEVLNQLDVE